MKVNRKSNVTGGNMFTRRTFSTVAAAAIALSIFTPAFAEDLAPLNSDSEPDRMDWS
jgi:hypothetical protein